MRSLIARRKHVDLTQAIAAFYDPNTPTRDAVALWRKALRRADKDMKDLLLSMARQAKEKKTDEISQAESKKESRRNQYRPVMKITGEPHTSLSHRATSMPYELR